VDGSGAENAVFGVEQDHPRLLLLQDRHLDLQEIGHILRRPDLRSLLGGEGSELPSVTSVERG